MAPESWPSSTTWMRSGRMKPRSAAGLCEIEPRRSDLAASIHLTILAFPIRIAEMPAQNLSGRIPRQGFDELHRFRRLEASNTFAAEVDDIGCSCFPPGLHHHNRLD